MRITRIFVEKLFGVFDHEICLNMDDRITIIHSPNGYGKTIILKMLDGLFNDRYSDLKNTSYKSFNVEFDNGQQIEIRRSLEPQNQDKNSPLIFTLKSENGVKIKSFTTKSTSEYIDIYTAMYENILKEFKGKTPGITIETLDPKNLEKHEEWLKKIKEGFNVYLIESERLLRISNEKYSHENGNSSNLIPTVIAYSLELVETVKERVSEYALISESLDRSFPKRVVKRLALDELTDHDLRNKLAELEESRNRLMESGLLEKDDEQDFPIQPQDIDSNTKNLLAVYIEDAEKKLSVFEDLSNKIELFRKIINSKFSYKEVVISREKGFIFRSKYPKEIQSEAAEFLSPSSLSSGEQHELVLLYELLFKVKKNSLVLIDEPELSLHVGWQVDFLRDLQEITALADLDILIATHSPSLIHDRWDLTVELKGVAS
jgi:predicted ATP-binding protein involved in virulence